MTTSAPSRDRTVAAIMAGGAAARMGGRPKGSLVVGGRPILERQLEALRRVFARVFVVANEPGPWAAMGLHVVADRVGPRAGPLAGIDAALADLRGPEDAVVCVGCDMPFLGTAALERLRSAPRDAIAAAPRIGGRAEPMFALYRRGAGIAIAEALSRGEGGIHKVLERLPTHWIDEAEWRAIDPELAFLINVNTPEDLDRAQKLASMHEA